MQTTHFVVSVAVIALLCILFIASTGNARAPSADPGTFSGKVRYVTDGDTFFIGDVKIRIWGIDALESDQPAQDPVTGRAVPIAANATKALIRLAKGRTVVCRVMHRDDYNRIVAQCFVGSEDIGRIMVQQGHALDWPAYSRGYYAEDEAYARQRGLGVWQTTFMQPWIWRRLNP